MTTRLAHPILAATAYSVGSAPQQRAGGAEAMTVTLEARRCGEVASRSDRRLLLLKGGDPERSTYARASDAGRDDPLRSPWRSSSSVTDDGVG